MAITRSQQAKQMLQDGGRIGLKAGAQFDTSLGGGAISPGTDIKGQFRGGNSGGDEGGNKLTSTITDTAKTIIPYLVKPKVKGLFDLIRTIKNFKDDTDFGLKSEVDTEEDDNMLLADVSQADLDAKKEIRGFQDMDYDTYKSIMEFKGGTNVSPFEFKGLQEGTITEPGRYTAADGGRIGLQEGGGIEQRLEQLGGDVSSAEQILQGINKRLETAESSLGSGGGGLGGGLGSIAQPFIGGIAQPRPGPFMGRPIMQPLLDQPLGQPLPTTLEAANPADIRRPNEFNSLEDAYKDAQTSAEAMRTGGNAPIVDATTGKFIPYAGELSFDDFSKNFSLQDNILTQNPDIRKFQNQPVFSTTTDPNFFNIKEGGVFKTPAEFAFKGSKNPQETYLSGIRERQGASGVPALGFAEGGNVVGGEYDFESARQMYGLGKLVKKFTKTVKKIAKSPIGKAAMLYFAPALIPGGASTLGGVFRNVGGLGGIKAGLFGTPKSMIAGPVKGLLGTGSSGTMGILGKLGLTSGGGSMVPNLGIGTLITGASALAGTLTPEQEQEAQELADNTDIDIEAARNAILQAAKENYAMDIRARGLKADGGLMRMGYQEGSKEPVAKKTMPLLDMGGMEKDYREDGGFVPIGRMEKADDVPARLSKNEFVFTADAVRNAGDGNIDKGAEVMYNMMKNLEAGGEVSEESQGLEGARRMFQTSQRLEEVL